MKQSLNVYERGAAGIKAIVALIILGIAIYVGITMIPIYSDHYSVQDKIKEDILFAGQRFGKEIEKGMKDQIFGYLNDIDAIYEKKNVSVSVNASTKLIKVQLWYEREHKIPGFPTRFEITEEGKYGL